MLSARLTYNNKLIRLTINTSIYLLKTYNFKLMKYTIHFTALLFVLLGISTNTNAQSKSIIFIDESGKNSQIDPTKLKSITIEAIGHDQKPHQFTGPLLHDVLNNVGVKFGESAKKQTISRYVLIRANDNYKCIFALAELDPLFNSSSVILAYQMDGKPFTESNGPYQIIAPVEKNMADG